jgi:hypothetical protein
MATFNLSYKDAINKKITTAGSEATAHEWSPSLKDEARFNIFNGNHVTPTTLYNSNSALYDRIEGNDVLNKYLWEQNGRGKNLQVLPTKPEDAFVLRSAEEKGTLPF